jgi:hypothetical protein
MANNAGAFPASYPRAGTVGVAGGGSVPICSLEGRPLEALEGRPLEAPDEFVATPWSQGKKVSGFRLQSGLWRGAAR